MKAVSYLTYAFLFIASLIMMLVMLALSTGFTKPLIESQIKASARYTALHLASVINELVSAPENTSFITELPRVNCSVLIDSFDVWVKIGEQVARAPHVVYEVSSRLACSSQRPVRIKLVKKRSSIEVMRLE